MKSYLPWTLAILLFTAYSSILFADDKAGDSGQMTIEKVVEMCEKKFSEESYPDPDERNKLIDQCIDENSANKSSE